MSEEAEILARASQRVGTVLHGKYHIDGVLGVGGMATVYAATHRNRKRFAVKMLHTEYSVRSDIRARFVREGYVANSVPHSGVVAVIDDDVDETGSAFLVMELLDGISVDALSTNGEPLPVREALAIAHQLLDVLEAAHRKSVVHRDIKPANLIVLRDGQLKVLDFGIARLRESDAALKSTHHGAVLGTPAFMAPEQALAMPENIDARTDVWAAGATLFTMLSACFVHPGANARQIMIRAATDPARSLDSVMPNLPASVIALVSRALAYERSQRWQSAAEMRDAVLETFSELYGTAPVRADVAALVERTSGAVATQPTQLNAVAASQKLLARSRSDELARDIAPSDPVLDRRALETTMATPVAVHGQSAPRKKPWTRLLVASGVAALAVAASLTLVRCGAAPPSPAPAAVERPVKVARPETAASTRAPEPGPAAREMGTPLAASEASPRPAKPARSSASAEKVSRPGVSTNAAPPAAAIPSAPSRAEDPLTLELQ